MIDLHSGQLGLALGGGGVKGLAHIPLLKWLDDQGLKPRLIAGTSMGAILGALYAAGLSGREIESRVLDHALPTGEKPSVWFRRRRQLAKWTKVFRWEKNRGGLVAADGLFEHLFSELIEMEFSDLPVRFKAVATRFHSGEVEVISEGGLLQAVQASMAVPGVFAPVTRNGELLVDGGAVNNLPCDLLEDCEVRIASDVIDLPAQEAPTTMEVVAGAINIVINHATRERLRQHPPTLLFEPDTSGIDAFDFHRLREAIARGEQAVARQLTSLGNG